MNRTFPGLGAAVVLLMAALAVQAGLAWLMTSVIGGSMNLDTTLLAGLANLFALSTVAVVGFGLAGTRPRFGSVAGTTGAFWAGLVLATLGGTVVLGEVANLTTFLVPLSPDLIRLFNHLTNGNLAITLFTLVVVAPLTEEALFRGLLLPSFVRRWGAVPGVVLSSALFGLFHLNVWQAPSAFLAGLFLGWLALKTGSLLYPMAVHALFNGLPVILSALGLSVRGYNTPLTAGPEFQPLSWLAAGGILLVAGLLVAKRWAPLSPPPVSDTVEP